VKERDKFSLEDGRSAGHFSQNYILTIHDVHSYFKTES